MELKEFVMEIAKGIEARLEGVKVTPTETMKNNGVILYLDLWFKKFNKGDLTLPDVGSMMRPGWLHTMILL